ncbi:hypothetical protein CC85DRAFT_243627 [Cutaneotrichosporon oleaginosum]|uniref:DNA polymerase lambda n=1 Tax=Cutaneotrichosporon oleaginosum TaxID=879819 RepID=A0A0J0XRP0_9TREE|nr:uncharacterized protein CC85DRAFT_243627 [Cutaneotrichosporon oleaginosum]KLT43747.1 hypothetical protein CC85DRAFT_243627 [Cutaneotrichosporon oleaginosum]TXT05164.1 hypothetical protein COLE_06484 [Cutaneotrichosporon oleaginosum]
MSALAPGTGIFAPPAWQDDVFAHLDRIETDSAFNEDPEDIEAYEAWVRSEVVRKLGGHGDTHNASSRVASSRVNHDVAPASRSSSPPSRLSSPSNSRIARPSGISLPHHTQLQTRHIIGTPARISTAPTIATPTLTAPLPHPPSTRIRLLDSPMSIATPQSPDRTDPSAIARGRRDDPATPVPLGTAELDKLKKRKGFQELTKHLADIMPPPALPQSAGRGLGRGRGRGRGRLGMTGRAKIGGTALAGTRICLAPSGPCKPRAAIIVQLGGEVVLHPDTAVTHVIEDSGASAAMLARRLGLQSLSDLPVGTQIVKWEWVTQCKFEAKLLPTDNYLTFPRTTQRSHTPSDSETESDRPRRMTAARRRTAGFDAGGLPPRSVPALQMARSGPHAITTRNASRNPSRPVSTDNLSSIHRSSDTDRIATRHEPSGGPGWIEPTGGEQDALDILIVGVKNGSVSTEGVESGSEAEDEPGNPSRKADFYKCGQKHEGEPSRGPNEWLAVQFDKLHHVYEGQQGKNEFAIRGYQRAAGILRRTDIPIISGAQARKIKGIGESLAQRIDEFLEGRQGRAYYEDTLEARTIATFKDVYGVGKNFAAELYRKGARTIEDLKTKEYGLTSGQRLYDDLISRIPRDECRQLFELIRDAALAIDGKLWVEIMGSYRRGAANSGDVDILITRDTADRLTHAGILYRLVHSLRQSGVITHDLSCPHDYFDLEAKWMGVGRIPGGKYRRIDILTIPFEYWGGALIYFTGNEVFNRSLRLYARKQGYSLNQRGLFRGVIRDRKGNKTTEGELVASRTEEEIFDVLGIRWRPPHQRRP